MPRLARLDAHGVLHHVIIRGIEQRNIFEDDIDRDNLLKRLGKLLPATKTSCYAWAMLTNHAHFLLRTGTTGLSLIMKRLLTGYVVSFNRRHFRHGPLFQNRFKSIVCQEDIYLKELVRYIHLNPLRAGIVSDLNSLKTYKYCGHAALMGKRVCKWMDTKYVLSYFGKTINKARDQYSSNLKDGVELGRRPELVGGGLMRSLGGWEAVKKMRIDRQERLKGDQRILGDSGFVSEILKEANEKFDRFYEMKQLGYDLNKVLERVCEVFRITKEDIFSRSKERIKSEARALFCFWMVRELGISQRELAGMLGMTQPGVGYAVIKGEAISKINDYQIKN